MREKCQENMAGVKTDLHEEERQEGWSGVREGQESEV